MSTDRLATLLPRLVVARKSRVCSTLSRLHGAGNLHHGDDDDDDDDEKEGDDDGDEKEGDDDINLLTLLSWHKAALLPRHRLAHRLLHLSKRHGQH